MALSATQRSCVILINVLGHSLDETCSILGLTEPAAMAGLHRGRLRLRELASTNTLQPALSPECASV